MGQRYVYGETVLLVNLVMNYLILWLTAKFANLAVNKKRLAAGALIGALYALAWFLPDVGPFYSMIGKFLFSVAIVTTAFAPVKPKKLLSLVAYFYLISFSLVGVTVGLSYFINSNREVSKAYYGVLNTLNEYFWYAILIAAALAAGTGILGPALLKSKITRNLFRVPLAINFGGQIIRIEALIDTGNNLRDPISQMPVIVVEYNALGKLLPVELQRAFIEGGDLNNFLDSVKDMEWIKRLRLIPFQSLGRSNGMLIAFRPDEVEIQTGSETIKTKDIIVGVHNQQLCPEGSYQALMHPDILHRAIS